jgi:thioredoxin-like negative regulator of GroEL
LKRWLPIPFAALAVLALAAALVPSGFEQAFMQLRDQDFPKATDSFARRWNAGDHSREVANALSELMVRRGEPARAADILRAYVAEHPDDRSALTRLAEIFRDDQQLVLHQHHRATSHAGRFPLHLAFVRAHTAQRHA